MSAQPANEANANGSAPDPANLEKLTNERNTLASENEILSKKVKELKEQSAKDANLAKETETLRQRIMELESYKKELEKKYDMKVCEETKSFAEEIKHLQKEIQSVGYTQTHREQDEQRPATDFYAGVVDIPNMKGLVEGWNVKINDWIEYQQLSKKHGTIVSVLGNYNRGKTKLLELLTGSHLPQGFNVNTQGISIVYLKDDANKQRPIIALDTKGGGLPLHINENSAGKDDVSTAKTIGCDTLVEKLRDHGATEDLLQNFILREASIIIVVVADLTFDDQKLVNKITNKFKGDPSKKIIVVHNLYHTHYVKDAKFKLQDSILKSFNLEEVEFKSQLPQCNEKYHVDSSKGKIPHVILAKEHTEAGDFYNPATVKYILDNLNANDTHNSVDIIHDFHRYLQQNIKDYMQADRDIKEEDIVAVQTEDGQPVSLRLENIACVQMKTVYADVFGDLQIFKDGFRPNYSLSKEIGTDGTTYLCLKIECPDECTEVKSKIKQGTDDFCIMVKGKKGHSGQKNELVGNNREFGEFFIETAPLDRSSYGIYYDTPPEKEYVNGMYMMKWKMNFSPDPDWL